MAPAPATAPEYRRQAVSPRDLKPRNSRDEPKTRCVCVIRRLPISRGSGSGERGRGLPRCREVLRQRLTFDKGPVRQGIEIPPVVMPLAA
jgi:hypothetical protein